MISKLDFQSALTRQHSILLAGALTLLVSCFVATSTLHALDANQDGMGDSWQLRYAIQPFTGSEDPDGDGRINLVEFINLTNPYSGDSGNGIVLITDFNHDGMDDLWAAEFHITASQRFEDPDGDGRKNIEESIVFSNPFVADTPQSGSSVAPGIEFQGIHEFQLRISHSAPATRYRLQTSENLTSWNTSQNIEHIFWGDGSSRVFTMPVTGYQSNFFRFTLDNPDSDGDGLNDWAEIQQGTDINNIDSDGDGISDGSEFLAGSDPQTPQSQPASVADDFYLEWVYLKNIASETWGDWGSGELYWTNWDYDSGYEEYSGVGPYAPQKFFLMSFPEDDWAQRPWIPLQEGTPLEPAARSLLAYHAGGIPFGGTSDLRKSLFALRATGVHAYQISRPFVKVTTVTNLSTHTTSEPLIEVHEMAVELSHKATSYSQPIIIAHNAVANQKTETDIFPIHFTENDSEDGFDNYVRLQPADKIEHPWLMVPGDGDRPALVNLNGAGTTTMEIEVNNPAISVTPNTSGSTDPLTLELKGSPSIPNTFMSIHDSRMLNIIAYKKRELIVYVWAVSLAKSDGSIIAPKNIPSASEFKVYMEQVYGRQMNVYSQTLTIGNITCPYDVPAPLTTPPVAWGENGMFDFSIGSEITGDEQVLLQNFDESAHINLYFIPTDINRCIGSTSKKDLDGHARTLQPSKDVVYVRAAGKLGTQELMLAAAHEIGHTGDLHHPRELDVGLTVRNLTPTYVARGWPNSFPLRSHSDDLRRLMLGPPLALNAAGTVDPGTGRWPSLLIKHEWETFRSSFNF